MDLARGVAAHLFERHHLAVFRFLLRVTGDRDLAKDLTQEVFLRVVRAASDYLDTGHALAWLFTIARNVVRDRHRELARRVTVVPLEHAAHVGASEPAVSTLELDRALATLQEADREVFLLRDTVGLSYQEIADLTSTSVAAVRSRLHRARRALADALAVAPATERLRRFQR